MIRILILIVSISSVYANYKVFRSLQVQVGVTQDFNTGSYKQENYIKLQNLDISFPNLTGTAFPLYAMLAKYHIQFGDLYTALKILNEYNEVNPHLKLKESLKAEIYYSLGIRDSSYYFSKIAYENLPKNSRHYQQYVAELTYLNDLDQIKKIFKESKAKENSEYWINFFAGVINLKSKEDKDIDTLAMEALEKFPENEKIKTISAYILFGQENVKKSYNSFELGITEFNKGDYDKAFYFFKEAIKLNTVDYSFYENAGMSLIKAKKHSESLFYLRKVIEDFNPKTGKAEYGLGIALNALENKEKGCEYFQAAMKFNYKPAFIDFKINCFK